MMKLIDSVHHMDVLLFTRLINSRFYHSVTSLATIVSRTANGPLYGVLAAYLFLSDGLQSPFLRSILIAFAIERPLYFIMKNCCKRNRPQAALKGYRSLLIPSDKFSFPSGHTSAAFMMASICGFFVPILVVPLIFWAILVGLSRVILGVHFPTDTVMGMILGVSISAYSLTQMT